MSPRRLWTAAAWIFTVATAAVACVLPFLRWVPQFGIDVLGVAWLLTNAANLFMWTLVISLLVVALYCWFRILLAEV